MNFSGAVSSDFEKLANIAIPKRPEFINFAATDFLSLRSSLIEYIKAVYPKDYNYFIESDLGMMFVEIVAYMGAVMSMKADMLANENFIATAKQRDSVRKLLELIGVRMKGPTSAAADAELVLTESPLVGELTISPDQRVAQATSPEDGGIVNYTLYKVVNGLVDTANNTGNIVLSSTEAVDEDETQYNNLVFLEGALVTENGDFGAAEAVKTISLGQAPVIEGSVEVFIESSIDTVNGAYKEVENLFFASGSGDRIFELVYDDNYNATIVFGDGTIGVSPDDSASYFITYRVGGGSRGNINSNSIIKSITLNSGSLAGTVTNIDLATGGANAETIQRAKKYAPLTFRRQDRLVTLEDYSVFANTFINNFGTIGKATAVVRKAYSSANIIDIYLLEKASDFQLQRATPNFKTSLLTAMNEKKMATDDVVIVDGLIRTIDLVVSIKIDQSDKQNEAQILSKVRNKVLSYMNIDNREFGESLRISELNRVIFEIPEIRISTIDNLDQDISVNFNEIIQLNNLTINVDLLA